MLDRLDDDAAAGDTRARTVRTLVLAQLAVLRDLSEPPTDDTPTLRRVHQSRRYQVWRLSHPYRPGHAVRTIVWFAPGGRVVVTLFANDKASMGDIFYSSVGSRADQIIDQWIQERQADS